MRIHISKLMAISAVFAALAGCASNPLVGQWRYNNASGTTVGLDLDEDEQCSLSMARFLGRDLEKGCRYSLNEQVTPDPKADEKASYLIYLKDDNGKCDVFADFEFDYDPNQGVVTFFVGDTPFVMQKQVSN